MARVKQREMLERERLTAKDIAASEELRKLWIADRVFRVAELQDTVDQINEQIEEIRDVETENPYDPDDTLYRHWTAPKPGRIPAMLVKMKLEALRQAAEELGQLPNDLPPQSNDAVYTVVGISNEDLKRLT